ncbi:SURF1 family protein [Glaciimonas immobilis]|uniref:SURF1-like protein n=1 Tax=Glaciimonas immobilis TaxID=728004 RepID=A0A840RPC6_9BURK|nr:SURF1 family protein [Glaciimonas immobilis]KAF3999764.1 SURF1 family protein [Glaciimonas immobilis]MBB5200227.1 cytochrome oxidase assembly protein ShyY1 [Glaciimonas immobilis]
MRLRFKFRLIPFVATLFLVALGISLAQWQTRRGDQKQAIANAIMQRGAQAPLALNAGPQNPEQLEYRHVTVRGEFVTAWPVYLDNRSYKGAPGFYVLMPLKLANSDQYVLVQRGWLPLNSQNRATLLPYVTPSGLVNVEGVVRRQAGRVLQLGQPTALQAGAIVQNLDIANLAAVSKFQLQPLLIEQTGNNQDGLVRDWPSPSLGIEMHRGYEFQWYALAVMAFLFFVVTGCRQGIKDAKKSYDHERK